MERETLSKDWQKAFGTKMPAARVDFLQRNLAYQAQVAHHGGLPLKVIKELERLATGTTDKTPRSPTIRPGTKLIRLWQGEPYEVTVVEENRFLYRDKSYPSLSAIAYAVTGTRWNGKVFFGIKKDHRHG